MAFSVGTVLRESLRRLATGPALLVLLALVVVETAVALVPSGGADLGLIAAGGGASPPLLTASPLPLVASLVLLVVLLYLSLLLVRVFADQWGIVERHHLTHNLGFGLLNFLGVFVVGLAALVVRLVLAGLFGIVGIAVGFVVVVVVAAASLFAFAFVAVEDDNVVRAFRRSFGVLADAPLAVAGLVVVLVLVSVVLQVVGTLLVGVLGPVSFLAPLVSTLVDMVGVVFLFIAAARAYDHWTAEAA
ncbi:hypothetical protein [Halococcus salsus]|uniref:hypothetical protein n=1 Tax=Halococcus salsus TaxID=2162894 RepID=UPI00135AADBF|nr:hypothetical protein [Halococcus salsus]